jgi:hypothetical protein
MPKKLFFETKHSFHQILPKSHKIIEHQISRGYWIHGSRSRYLDFENDINEIIPRHSHNVISIPEVIINKSSPTYNFLKWDKERMQILEKVRELEESFSNKTQRQIEFSILKNSVRHLRDSVGLENKGFLRVLNMCYDALKNTKSEKMTKPQVDQLKFIFGKFNENIDDFVATELEGILIDSGLRPIPALEGIADLYK